MATTLLTQKLYAVDNGSASLVVSVQDDGMLRFELQYQPTEGSERRNINLNERQVEILLSLEHKR